MEDVNLEIGKEANELRGKQIAEQRKKAKIDMLIIRAQINFINKLLEHVEEFSDIALDFPTVAKWIEKIASPELVAIKRISDDSGSIIGTIPLYWGKPGKQFSLRVFCRLQQLDNVEKSKIMFEVVVTD